MNRPAPDASPPSNRLQLGTLAIDPVAGELTGPGGREQLDPKVTLVLVELARRADEVVSREELLAAVWPGAVVTDDVLRRCIYQLRAHLRRAGGDERYKSLLETLPKRGYRLHRDLDAAGAPAVTARSARKAVITGGALIALMAFGLWWAATVRNTDVPPNAPPSIAVLAFADMSEGRDHEHFADGMAEEILNLLTRLPNLQVIARTSSFSFKGGHADVITIGKALDAGYVLEGSVRPSGERVRVTAQLVDARTGVHVWSETYDRKLDDLLEVQSSIAESVARSLEITLAEGSLASGTRTVNPEAYEYVLHGRYLHNRRGPGDIAAAEQYFRRAVAADETYAPAWAALAGTLLVRFFEEGATDAAALESMREAVTRALELDPFMPEAQARAAQYYAHAGDFDRAMHHRERALAVGPNNPLVLGASSGWALSGGDYKLALNRQQRAVQVDPLNPVARANLVIELARAARFDEALAEFQRVKDLYPTRSSLNELEGDILLLAGRFDDALASFERLPEGPKREMGLTLTYRELGRDADSRTQMQKLTARSDYERSQHLAEIHAQWGEQEQAFAWLAAAWEVGRAAAPTPGLRRYPHYVMQSPYLRPLYGDPRWKHYLWEANT